MLQLQSQDSTQWASLNQSWVAPHLTFADDVAAAELKRRRRQTLYIGLSDGARIDVLRRANAGVLVNDQIVLAAHIDREKWEDLSTNLAIDLAKLGGTGEVTFRNVVLIDDFTASGTTFVRKKPNGSWTGKIYKFFTAVAETRKQFLSNGKQVPLLADARLVGVLGRRIYASVKFNLAPE